MRGRNTRTAIHAGGALRGYAQAFIQLTQRVVVGEGSCIGEVVGCWRADGAWNMSACGLTRRCHTPDVIWFDARVQQDPRACDMRRLIGIQDGQMSR